MTNDITIKIAEAAPLGIRRIETEINGFRDPRVQLIDRVTSRTLQWNFAGVEIHAVLTRDSLEFRVLEKRPLATTTATKKAA
jgi:hypothetical protein